MLLSPRFIPDICDQAGTFYRLPGTKVLARAFVVLCCAMVSSRAEAHALCWIDHVTRAEGGLNVYFRRSAMLRVFGKRTAFTVGEGVVRDENGDVRDHLFVRQGSEFYTSQISQNVCSYAVNANEALGSLTVGATVLLPGLSTTSTTEIAGADGTDSQPVSKP